MNFKKGDKIRCIVGGYDYLTEDDIYEVLEDSASDYVTIEDDDGDVTDEYEADLFELWEKRKIRNWKEELQ